MEIERSLLPLVRRDLDEKMVFVAGPRQVGKTTLARQLLARFERGVYFSWDRAADRKQLLAGRWPEGPALVVLDELHKYLRWKRWLKGEFDAQRDRLRFLVTGSARLDVYRRGGDSLQGRYHHYRLHPLTCGELEHGGRRALPEPGAALAPLPGARASTLQALLACGGFPEPFLRGEARHARRWRLQRTERLLREDVRDLEQVRDLSLLEQMAELLAGRVGSLLSLNNLRQDLEVSHRAVSHWLAIFERLYFAFAVRPFAGKLAASLRRMPKVYLWEPSAVDDAAARFENLVALHLLKLVHLLQDAEGQRAELWYLRDAFGREVDFLVTVGNKPWFAVEAKLSEQAIAPGLRYFRERLAIPHCYQLVCDAKSGFVEDGIHCLPAHQLLAGLP